LIELALFPLYSLAILFLSDSEATQTLEPKKNTLFLLELVFFLLFGHEQITPQPQLVF